MTVVSGRNLGLLYAGSRRYLLHTLSLSVSLPLRGVKKKTRGLFVRNFPLIWPLGRASISSTSYLQAWDEGNWGCKGTQHIQCSFFLVSVLNAHKYLFWGDWLPLGWEFRYLNLDNLRGRTQVFPNKDAFGQEAQMLTISGQLPFCTFLFSAWRPLIFMTWHAVPEAACHSFSQRAIPGSILLHALFTP